MFDYNGSETGFENQYVFSHGTKTGFEKPRDVLRSRLSRIQDGRKGACNQWSRKNKNIQKETKIELLNSFLDISKEQNKNKNKNRDMMSRNFLAFTVVDLLVLFLLHSLLLLG